MALPFLSLSIGSLPGAHGSLRRARLRCPERLPAHRPARAAGALDGDDGGGRLADVDADRGLCAGHGAEEVRLELPLRAGVPGHWRGARPDPQLLPAALTLVQGPLPGAGGPHPHPYPRPHARPHPRACARMRRSGMHALTALVSSGQIARSLANARGGHMCACQIWVAGPCACGECALRCAG